MGTQTHVRLPQCRFLDDVRRSGLLAPDDLIGVLAKYDPEEIEKADPIKLATLLVSKKLLTKFQAMHLLNGRTKGFTLGAYKILEGIRQDRVGMVFMAEHMDTKERAAVKVLPTDRVADNTVYQPFLKEAKQASEVNDPNVARVLEVGVANGTHYVACEFISAPTLDKILAKQGPVPVSFAAMAVARVAVGLVRAHAKGMVHRDIKPANIAVMPDRKVKLLDLGLTHMLDNPWAKVTKRINLKEYAEEIAHIPPEQAWGCELDARSDVYSLGSTFYTLLTGQTPFPGLALQTMTDRQVKDLPKPSDLRAGIPPEIDAVVQKMGAKDPTARYQTAAEVVNALHAYLPVAEWTELSVRIGPTLAERRAQEKKEKAAGGFFGWLSGLFGKKR